MPRRVAGIGVLAIAVLGAACGTSGSSTGANLSTSTTHSTGPTTTLPLALSSAPSSTLAPGPAPPFPSLSQLESLSNYSYSEVAGNGRQAISISGNVASKSNYEFKSTVLSAYTVVANGRTYTTLGNKVYSSPATSADVPPLPGFAVQVASLVSAPSAMLLRYIGACSFAGERGDAWTITTPSAPANFGEIYRVCTDASSGYLLYVIAEVETATSAPTVNEEFQVNSVGNVAPIRPPSAE